MAQSVFDPEKHKTLDETPASEADAKRMLEAYFAVEQQGSGNAEARRLAREAVKFAEAVKHDRSADAVRAGMCLEATLAIRGIVASIAGKPRLQRWGCPVAC